LLLPYSLHALWENNASAIAEASYFSGIANALEWFALQNEGRLVDHHSCHHHQEKYNGARSSKMFRNFIAEQTSYTS